MIEKAGDVPVQVRFTQNPCGACDYMLEFSNELADNTDDISM